MTETRILLDPTSERSPSGRERLPRPESLKGLTIGLLDISKTKGDLFLDGIADLLKGRGLSFKHYKKPTFARVLPTELTQTISAECDVVIEALADWGSCTSCSVHDISDLENHGIPGVFIASDEFVQAADEQSAGLGFNPASVFVPHPIQDRTDDEMKSLAENSFDAILDAIQTR